VGLHDPERVVIDVGRRIAELRARAGLTQSAFARLLGGTLRYIQQLEGGERNLTLHTLTKIGNALGVHPRALLAATKYRRPAKAGRPPAGGRATPRASPPR
jgi:transcriptional regulator with XRE-family HTH domain